MMNTWSTDTYWFDVSVVVTVLMFGHLFFGRFVEHQSRGRRVVKSLAGIVVLVATSAWAGRGWMYVLLGVMVLAVVAVHGWWLPKHGVNGWTAEPRDRYLALIERRGRG